MNRRDLLRFALAVPALVPMIAVSPVLAAPARKLSGGTKLVMIDPGHGGRDPGAIGVRGTYEKTVTLDIAKEMARMAGKTKGWKVALTRDTDDFIDLKDRVRIAQDAGADLFISIHADSAPNRQARGLSAYTLSDKASDDFAASIAQQENIAGGAESLHLDQNVAAILADLAVRRDVTRALKAKQAIVKGAGKELRLLDNPMRSANFAVLKAPEIPSLLIETGFLSNAQDENLLRDASQRRRIAGILARELTAVMNTHTFA